jgi:hypothetical protein
MPSCGPVVDRADGLRLTGGHRVFVGHSADLADFKERRVANQVEEMPIGPFGLLEMADQAFLRVPIGSYFCCRSGSVLDADRGVERPDRAWASFP